MSQNHEPKLGTAPPSGAVRDAVHVAIVPAVAVRDMVPGERLQNGIVDPYRTAVKAGERYWLCLYPGTVTGLRHGYSHPAFPDEPAGPRVVRMTAAALVAAIGRGEVPAEPVVIAEPAPPVVPVTREACRRCLGKGIVYYAHAAGQDYGITGTAACPICAGTGVQDVPVELVSEPPPPTPAVGVSS